ncbi:hypothetical protein Tco_0309667 [Tanacetum coccineum]
MTPHQGDGEAVVVIEDSIIEDVDVDIEDFRDTYVRNRRCPVEEESQDEELDLDDFDSASDPEVIMKQIETYH